MNKLHLRLPGRYLLNVVMVALRSRCGHYIFIP